MLGWGSSLFAGGTHVSEEHTILSLSMLLWMLQLRDAYDNPQKLAKFIVEVLYGAGNKAAAMLPSIAHVPRTDACDLYKQHVLCAAACARMVSCQQP